jgi:hypothetical protein
MEQIRQHTAKKKQEIQNAQKVAVEGIAELEDRLQKEDDRRENERVGRYKPNLEEC